jgi:hypothetical protein
MYTHSPGAKHVFRQSLRVSSLTLYGNGKPLHREANKITKIPQYIYCDKLITYINVTLSMYSKAFFKDVDFPLLFISNRDNCTTCTCF